MSTEAAVLFAHLARFRRRAALVIFISSVLMAASATLAIAAGTVLLNLLPASAAFPGAAAAAVVIAAIVTITRLPTGRATALAVDRRLELHDRVVTAFQCASSPDAFSRLVVRDAVSRLSTAEPAAAFPMRLPRMAAAAPVAIGLAILVAAALPSMRGFSLAGGALASVIGGTVAEPASSREASRRAGSQPAGSTPVQARDIHTTAVARTQPSQAKDGDSSGQSNGDARSDSRGAAAPDASPLSQSHLAGGVSGASERRDVIRETPLRESVAYGVAYRTGRAAAETAIVQDRVPSERRAYVRAYFESIRPQVGK